MRRQYQLALLILSPMMALSLLLVLVGSVRAATITVTTTADIISSDDQCSLREAVQAVNTNVAVNECVAGSAGVDIITFNLPANSTITLISGPLTLSEAVFIDGSNAPNLIISGNNASKVFGFSAPATLLNLTVADGSANGSGGAIYSSAALTLTYVNVFSSAIVVGNSGGGISASGTLFIEGGRFENNRIGSVGGLGGGLYANTLVITGAQFISNTAGGNGGGLYANTLVITGTQFISNTARTDGGGAYVKGTATISNTYFENNQGNGKRGGGLAVYGVLTLVNSHFIHNIIASEGGGAYAPYAMISDTYFEHNGAKYGGGLEADTAILTNTQFVSNTAQIQGGGVYAYKGSALNQVSFSHNTAEQGGGLYLSNGTLNQSGGTITLTSNTAITGGGLYVASGTLTLTQAYLLSNTAGMGGAVHQQGGTITITQSCIVFNSDAAVNYAAGISPLAATGNWWGAASGPGGAGPGSGDSVSSNVDFSGFLTSPPASCPSQSFVDLTISKYVTPSTAWPGQTITYTITFSNVGTELITGSALTDFVPISLTNLSLISSNVVLTSIGASSALVWQVQDLPPNHLGIITLTGQISPSLSPTVFTNTAMISAPSDLILGNNQASTSIQVLVPVLRLSKLVNDATPLPGQSLTYTLIVSNSGGLNATEAVISDTLPAGLDFVGPVSIQGSPGSPGIPPILASGLTIAAGKRITITFPVTVNTGLAAGTIITNIAAVTSTQTSSPVTAIRAIRIDYSRTYLPLLLKKIEP